MKRIILPLITVLLVLAALTACGSAPVSNNQPEFNGQTAVYEVDGLPLSLKAAKNARLRYEGVADLIFTFTLPACQHAHLTEECDGLVATATVADGDGLVLPAAITDRGTTSGEWLLEVSLGGIFVEDYYTEYTVTMQLEFVGEDGKPYTVSAVADATTVYDVAYIEYCDRSAEESSEYPNSTGTDYSPYSDLSSHYAVLSSILPLFRLGTSVCNTYERGVYESVYVTDYFDGVLTVSMRNGSPINPNLLKGIFVNGEEIYFEVNDGIIRVVLEAAK